MTLELKNGECLKLMKEIPAKSIDLLICDLPYGETNCKWDIKINMDGFWSEFKRIRKHDRVACIHFCSTKFGYQLIKSWEKGFKMDMVWKKRNKTGGLQSRNRPMRNHEMVYFFYDKCPKYNRDKYHKRIQAKPKIEKSETAIMGKEPVCKVNFGTGINFDPPNPVSIINEVEEKDLYGEIKSKRGERVNGLQFSPPNPVSIVNEVEEDEPKSMFESQKVFIGKRWHQTEKTQDILEFFLKYWTDEGDTILDPTMGSGSTGVACKKLKRNFIGFELNETIFKTAEGRISGKLLKKDKK